ncbi:MAG: hypothetical protein ACREHD_03225, partial [Pirellulales bacterium]
VRIVTNWNLLVIEKALAIMLRKAPTPSDGYRLAADYCRHDDPRYIEGLSGVSETKILEIVRFMFTREALEDWSSGLTEQPTRAEEGTKRRGKGKSAR